MTDDELEGGKGRVANPIPQDITNSFKTIGIKLFLKIFWNLLKKSFLTFSLNRTHFFCVISQRRTCTIKTSPNGFWPFFIRWAKFWSFLYMGSKWEIGWYQWKYHFLLFHAWYDQYKELKLRACFQSRRIARYFISVVSPMVLYITGLVLFGMRFSPPFARGQAPSWRRRRNRGLPEGKGGAKSHTKQN